MPILLYFLVRYPEGGLVTLVLTAPSNFSVTLRFIKFFGTLVFLAVVTGEFPAIDPLSIMTLSGDTSSYRMSITFLALAEVGGSMSSSDEEQPSDS
jgi:hypothetical protein